MTTIIFEKGLKYDFATADQKGVTDMFNKRRKIAEEQLLGREFGSIHEALEQKVNTDPEFDGQEVGFFFMAQERITVDVSDLPYTLSELPVYSTGVIKKEMLLAKVKETE